MKHLQLTGAVRYSTINSPFCEKEFSLIEHFENCVHMYVILVLAINQLSVVT